MTEVLKRTPLYDLHMRHGAKMVPFAGYEMPLHYKDGIIKEHLRTRQGAGLFDVSHMGQILLVGDVGMIEKFSPIDTQSLSPGRQRYALLTTPEGGVLDDFMATTDGWYFSLHGLRLIVNASRKDFVLKYLLDNRGQSPTVVSPLLNHALLALQGPAAAEVLSRVIPEIETLKFMHSNTVLVVGSFVVGHGIAHVARSGYTGEDGFEISIHNADVEGFVQKILEHKEVALAGLGARDSLRLEAGLCLYGNELDEKTSLVEAGLSWTIPKSRREGARRGGFVGADIVLEQLEKGVPRTRIGLVGETKMPVRHGAELQTISGEVAGTVTSGAFSPTLDRPVAMAYVKKEFGAPDTTLHAVVRDKKVPMKIVPLPFVPHKYVR